MLRKSPFAAAAILSYNEEAMALSKRKKRGIIVMCIGVFVGLACLPFLSGYQPGQGFITNLFSLKVFVIPYRFILALAVLILFAGIRMLDKVHPTEENNSPSTM
jgi:hypothetical protein